MFAIAAIANHTGGNPDQSNGNKRQVRKNTPVLYYKGYSNFVSSLKLSIVATIPSGTLPKP